MKQTPRQLLPAATAAPSSDKHEQPAKTKANKRQAVSRACNNCRKIKCKCDGVRPTCAKCFERNTNCVYDTEEGISRTASLRNTNDFLTARMGKYEETFDVLLATNPSQDTVALIHALRLAQGAHVKRKVEITQHSGHSPGSEDDGDHYQGRDKDHYQSPQAYSPGSHTNGNISARSKQDSFAAPNSSIKWMVGGYNPNDGRITGKQHGWHPVLVINQSQVIQSADECEELVEDSFQPLNFEDLEGDRIDKYMKRPRSLIPDTSPEDAAAAGPSAKRLRFDIEDYEEAPPLQGDLWRYHNVNEREFFPPPGAVTAYGNLPMSSSLLTNGYPDTIQRHQLLNCRLPEHTIPPIHVDEASAMSRMYTTFKEAALCMIGNGTPVIQVLGHHDIVCVDLLFRSREPHDLWTVDN